MSDDHRFQCPIELGQNDRVTLAHGEGGLAARKLFSDVLAPLLGIPADIQDAASLPTRSQTRLAISTDSYVVTPLFFPGGDIGRLAVYGTVNDLAVAGATPEFLTLSLIIEEGLELTALARVLDSVRQAAELCQIRIVAGDTKVVPVGAADQIYLTTCGIGHSSEDVQLSPQRAQPGDRIIVSGPIGCHGIAVMNARERLGFEPPPTSDCGPLLDASRTLLSNCGTGLKTMRDATRGGVSAVLHEWARDCHHTMAIEEQAIPVLDSIRSGCELLGIDPLHVANEGTLVAIVASEQLEMALRTLRKFPQHRRAQCIGHVTAASGVPVLIERLFGTLHPLDEPTGTPLPRIC